MLVTLHRVSVHRLGQLHTWAGSSALASIVLAGIAGIHQYLMLRKNFFPLNIWLQWNRSGSNIHPAGIVYDRAPSRLFALG